MSTERLEQDLHYQLMGLGLTLLEHKPQSCLYALLDDALVRHDWTLLREVRCALADLSAREQGALQAGTGGPMAVEDAIAQLETRFYLQRDLGAGDAPAA